MEFMLSFRKNPPFGKSLPLHLETAKVYVEWLFLKSAGAAKLSLILFGDTKLACDIRCRQNICWYIWLGSNVMFCSSKWSKVTSRKPLGATAIYIWHLGGTKGCSEQVRRGDHHLCAFQRATMCLQLIKRQSVCFCNLQKGSRTWLLLCKEAMYLPLEDASGWTSTCVPPKEATCFPSKPP